MMELTIGGDNKKENVSAVAERHVHRDSNSTSSCLSMDDQGRNFRTKLCVCFKGKRVEFRRWTQIWKVSLNVVALVLLVQILQVSANVYNICKSQPKSTCKTLQTWGFLRQPNCTNPSRRVLPWRSVQEIRSCNDAREPLCAGCFLLMFVVCAFCVHSSMVFVSCCSKVGALLGILTQGAQSYEFGAPWHKYASVKMVIADPTAACSWDLRCHWVSHSFLEFWSVTILCSFFLSPDFLLFPDFCRLPSGACALTNDWQRRTVIPVITHAGNLLGKRCRRDSHKHVFCWPLFLFSGKSCPMMI